MNSNLIKLFEALTNTSNVYRARAFENIIAILSNITYEVNKKTLHSLLAHLVDKSGIGKGIISRIEEYVKTGDIAEAREILNKEDSLKEFLGIKGVGKVLAQEWVDSGIHNMSELKRKIAKGEITLTMQQKYGILYYRDLNERIPRKEVQDYTDTLKDILTFNLPNLRIDIVGSYRRLYNDIGDVDVLIVHHNMSKIKKIIESMDSFIDVIAGGSQNMTYLYKFAGKVRQCDILLTTHKSYIPALIYFTGSKNHGIMLRKRAKLMGYTLNQYSLSKANTEGVIKLDSEEELYKKLGLEYVSPENRI
jgi:DNA polymerase/3'-5' exonuclease PolX